MSEFADKAEEEIEWRIRMRRNYDSVNSNQKLRAYAICGYLEESCDLVVDMSDVQVAFKLQAEAALILLDLMIK